MKDTRFLLPQSEIRARSEVKRSATSSLESRKSCRVGLLSKEVEKCKVESSAYEWIDKTVCYRKIIDEQKEESG